MPGPRGRAVFLSQGQHARLHHRKPGLSRPVLRTSGRQHHRAGVSRDSLKSHENFKTKYELLFLLISDADETVCNLYGVIKQKNMYGKQVRGIERSTFLIDAYGVLQEWRG